MYGDMLRSLSVCVSAEKLIEYRAHMKDLGVRPMLGLALQCRGRSRAALRFSVKCLFVCLGIVVCCSCHYLQHQSPHILYITLYTSQGQMCRRLFLLSSC